MNDLILKRIYKELALLSKLRVHGYWKRTA
jgi:hypothetical protein